MSNNLTPIEVCERLVAPVEELAVLCGFQRKTSYRWRTGSGWRDVGDLPPRANRALLDHSDRHALGLTAEHLIRGASAAEVAAILADRGAQTGTGTKTDTECPQPVAAE